ncbi:MAG: hypothetical protein KME35_19610 [Aphanocapsa sp. GSE-SYN-MK-11-07L]|nr:hypothetical protein [Aphanocapsa sp. GSE-SYN-MK-11-07L]
MPLDQIAGGHWSVDSLVIAQQFKDTLGNDFASVWNNFIKTGQVWALLIGIVAGYVIRTFTSF